MTTKKAPRKKKSPNYRLYDLKKADQFALCDAMRYAIILIFVPSSPNDPNCSYIHAFEVGRDPTSPKYELAIRLRTARDGAVIRTNFKLPHPVKLMKVCVICPPGSRAEAEAKSAGASLVGEEAVIEAVKAGNLDFERCICHPDSLEKVTKAGIARILGPRGLMPSLKMNTVRKDIKVALKTMVEGSGYRERSGVLRLAVGQLAFTPEQLKTNIQAVIAQIKRDAADLSDRISKEIHEIVGGCFLFLRICLLTIRRF
jgi:large subunit ribosomal protein L1